MVQKTEKSCVRTFYNMLIDSYGHQGWWPLLSCNGINPTKSGSINGYHPNNYEYPKTHNEEFEIAVGVILTQNTAWTNVEQALTNLDKCNLLDPVNLSECDEAVIKEAIRPAGYFNQKCNYLKNLSVFFIKNSYRTPSRAELLSVRGVGKETADTILLYAFKVPEFVIDTYTKRVSSALGIANPDTKYDELKSVFESSLPKDFKIYQEYHALLVEHAKRYYSKKPYGVNDKLIDKCK